MANQEHVDLLKQGVAQWNAWREQHQEIQPDLSGADLTGTDLNNHRRRMLNHIRFVQNKNAQGEGSEGEDQMFDDDLREQAQSEIDQPDINLSSANLSGANLSGANLEEAHLFRAHIGNTSLSAASLINAKLSGANLIESNLQDARLTGANLINANLKSTDLRGADLRKTRLIGADLDGADLRGAKLEGAEVLGTVFANVDFSETTGLAEVEHIGRSRVELHTIRLPQNGSALYFLRGTGVPEEWIDDYRARMMHPIHYHTCFISHSSKDETFARRLHADLQEHGVRCWFALHDMKIGDKIRPSIDKAIHLQEKVLLILSAHSVTSDWVEHEVETALAKERKDKRVVLFPVRVDDALLEQAYEGWPALVQNERFIGDFTNWTDPHVYQRAFERLLRDLKKS